MCLDRPSPHGEASGTGVRFTAGHTFVSIAQCRKLAAVSPLLGPTPARRSCPKLPFRSATETYLVHANGFLNQKAAQQRGQGKGQTLKLGSSCHPEGRTTGGKQQSTHNCAGRFW